MHLIIHSFLQRPNTFHPKYQFEDKEIICAYLSAIIAASTLWNFTARSPSAPIGTSHKRASYYHPQTVGHQKIWSLTTYFDGILSEQYLTHQRNQIQIAHYNWAARSTSAHQAVVSSTGQNRSWSWKHCDQPQSTNTTWRTEFDETPMAQRAAM